jgi:hypothetical protein
MHGAALFYNPWSAIGTVAGQYALSRMLARPVAAKAVARFMRAHLDRVANPGGPRNAALLMATRSLANVIAGETGGDAAQVEAELKRATGGQ